MASSTFVHTLRHYSPPAPAYELFQSIPAPHRAVPFVKWAGSKKRHIEAYDPLFPAHFEAYHEPFLGGGSVFMYLMQVGRIKRCTLSDLNSDLIHLYRIIRDDVERLIATLREYKYEKDFYYFIRAQDVSQLPDVERAARMLYLNRTCFNGLYRVNSSGQFNVPFGRYKNPVICNEENLRNVSRTLQGMELQRWSFETVLEFCQPGDFVYLDPPAQPTNSSMRYTEYSPETYGESHQGRLREIFRLLDQRGCLSMLSIPNTPLNRRLFQGYNLKEISVPRAIHRDGRRRGRRTELVVRNYTCTPAAVRASA